MSGWGNRRRIHTGSSKDQKACIVACSTHDLSDYENHMRIHRRCLPDQKANICHDSWHLRSYHRPLPILVHYRDGILRSCSNGPKASISARTVCDCQAVQAFCNRTEIHRMLLTDQQAYLYPDRTTRDCLCPACAPWDHRDCFSGPKAYLYPDGASRDCRCKPVLHGDMSEFMGRIVLAGIRPFSM